MASSRLEMQEEARMTLSMRWTLLASELDGRTLRVALIMLVCCRVFATKLDRSKLVEKGTKRDLDLGSGI